MPQVSIIVPVYKVEKYLDRCIESILAQTYTDFELILVDDGSPDNCPVICDSWAEKEKRINVIHKDNGGVSSARNVGLDAASGECIVFVDSDDYLEVNYVNELMKEKSHDFVTAGFQMQNHDLSWNSIIFPDETVEIHLLKSHPSLYLGKYYFGSPWAKLYQRRIIEENSLRFHSDVRSGEDTLFTMQYLAYASDIRILPTCGYCYCFYPGSLANSRHENYWIWRIMVEEQIKLFFSNENSEEAIYLNNRFFDVLCDLLRQYAPDHDRKYLLAIYRHPFFAPAIDMKKKLGNRQEKLLLFFMKQGHYSMYEMVLRWLTRLSAGKRRLLRHGIG